MADVLSDSLSRWTSADVTEAVSRPDALVAVCVVAADIADLVRRQDGIGRPMMALRCVGRRAEPLVSPDGSRQYPLAVHWRAVLPNIIALVRTLHELWAARGTGALPELGEWMAFMSVEEEAAVLARVKNVRSDAERHSREGSMAYFAYSLRTSAYSLIGMALRHGSLGGLFSSELLPALEALHRSCFTPALLGCMSVHHLRMMVVEVMTPLVVSCPTELYERVLAPVASPVLAVLVDRLRCAATTRACPRAPSADCAHFVCAVG